MPVRSYLTSDAAAEVLRDTPFTAFVVCRRYWSINLRAVEKLGKAQGGRYVEVKSLLALLSYLGIATSA